MLARNTSTGSHASLPISLGAKVMRSHKARLRFVKVIMFGFFFCGHFGGCSLKAKIPKRHF